MRFLYGITIIICLLLGCKLLLGGIRTTRDRANARRLRAYLKMAKMDMNRRKKEQFWRRISDLVGSGKIKLDLKP